MRTKITMLLLVCILVGCAKNADIESVNVPVEPASQAVLPKISKDISVLSADDAIKVANLFSHGKVLTKSETMKDVRNVVPIKDASDRTLMYAVNYLMLIYTRVRLSSSIIIGDGVDKIMATM